MRWLVSSGKAHAAATKLLAIPAGLLAAQVVPGIDPIMAGGMAVVGCLTGLVLDPDLDVDGLTRSEWQILKRFWILGVVWVVLWWPYAKLIPHRSPLSHFPVMGTVGRLFYLLLWAVAITSLASWPLGWVQWIPDVVAHPLFAAWLVGLMISDAGHWAMDRVSTGIKRWKR